MHIARPTHVRAILDNDARQGFAPCRHGSCPLEANAELSYKVVDGYQAPEREQGLSWDDPMLAITWPVSAAVDATASDKDRTLEFLADLSLHFLCKGSSCPNPS